MAILVIVTALAALVLAADRDLLLAVIGLVLIGGAAARVSALALWRDAARTGLSLRG